MHAFVRVSMRASARRAITALLCALAMGVPGASSAQATLPVAFALRTMRGDTVHVGAGSPVTLVAVFASWCRSCKEEIAVFNRLQLELAPLGVRVVALSADEGSDEHLTGWLARYDAQYPVARDTSRAALRALGVVGVPEAYLVGADGRVIWSRRGPIESGLPSLRKAVANAGNRATGRRPRARPTTAVRGKY